MRADLLELWEEPVQLMPVSMFLLAVAALLPSAVAADEVPELLVPVTEEEEGTVRANDSYLLKRYSYFSKRHRIVRVNSNVLFNEPRFRITFFDDASIIVRRERVNRGAMVTWEGQMENQPITVEELVRAGDSPDVARDWYSALVNVSISAAKQVYDPKTGRSESLVKRDLRTLRPNNAVDSAKGQYAFYQASAEISPLSMGKTYRLRPLEWDSRYHILYEEDPAKRISPGVFGGGPFNETDMRYRQLQYKQYLEFLGPDPRDNQ